MFLAISPSQFNPHFVMLSEKTKNNIMENGDFYRVYYSDTLSNSNGLYIYFSLKNVSMEKYYNKIKCGFSFNENAEIISSLKLIESKLLDNITFTHKKKVKRIDEQLSHYFIKIFTDKEVSLGKNKNINLILKISGIWCDYKSYGITFRFYVANHL